MLAVYLRHTQMLTNLFEEFIRHLATACPRSIDCPVDIRTLAAAEQLRRRQTTSCQVGCRWPPTHEAPLPRRNELITRNFALVTRLSHCFYLLAGVDQPQCAIFQCPLTVKHVLIEFSDFNVICYLSALPPWKNYSRTLVHIMKSTLSRKHIFYRATAC